MKFKVGDEVIYYGSYFKSFTGSIGTIVDKIAKTPDFRVLITFSPFPETEHRLNNTWGLPAEGLRKLTKLDKALK